MGFEQNSEIQPAKEQDTEELRRISERVGKEKEWQRWQKEVEGAADMLGYKVDERIKDAVVAFNVLGLPTAQSCEGHLDHGYATPWVRVEAPDQPEERFIGEKKIYQKIADKYTIPLEDVVRSNNQAAWIETMAELENAEETTERKEWRKKTKELEQKAVTLLEEFYKSREAEANVRLDISENAEGSFEVHNGGEDYRPVFNMSEEQKKGLEERQKQYQEEMQQFAGFLKEKYFSEK